jgi:hypothetical protein
VIHFRTADLVGNAQGQFVAWARRSSHPLIDLALFSNRDFTIGTALATVANVALFGLLFVTPQYFQDVAARTRSAPACDFCR